MARKKSREQSRACSGTQFTGEDRTKGSGDGVKHGTRTAKIKPSLFDFTPPPLPFLGDVIMLGTEVVKFNGDENVFVLVCRFSDYYKKLQKMGIEVDTERNGNRYTFKMRHIKKQILIKFLFVRK